MPVLSTGFLASLPPGATISDIQPQTGRINPDIMFRYAKTPTSLPVPNIDYPQADNTDWRVRISLAPGANYFSNDPSNVLLRPLSGSGKTGTYGVIFPYTPTIQVTHAATYASQRLLHNNYTQYFYENSEVQAISISGDFTVQSIDEGQYLLAVIYFFRSVTKMFFGNDAQAGNPPPLLYLNGYGQYYLPNVPCVVTSFSHTMPAEVDYLEIPDPMTTAVTRFTGGFASGQNTTRLPTTSQISLIVQPLYSRLAQTNFSLTDFARGALVNRVTDSKATAYGASPGNPAKFGNRGNGGFL